MAKKKNRSAGYQHLIVETCYPPEIIAECSDQQGLTGFLNDSFSSTKSALKEQLEVERDRLKLAFWRIVDEQLTSRQSQVLHLVAADLTQIEIAKKLKVNQSSITKSIHGNCDYRNGKKVYGGAMKKLSRLIKKDTEVQEILKNIADIQEELT